MKVALIFPNIFETEKIKTTTIFPPLSIAYLASVLQRIHCNVQVFDAAADKLTRVKLIQRLQKFQPDIVGITTNVTTAFMGRVTAKKCRKFLPAAKIIFGGPWASVTYNDLILENVADFVVIGEGEKTIQDLLICIQQNGNFSQVRGIAFKGEDGSIIVTPAQELIKNLDELPFPAWDLFPKPSKYPFTKRARNFFPIITSRGCPYNCIHCSKVIFGRNLRYRSVENVVQEIIYLHAKHNAQEILIVDDTFTQDMKRAFAILLKIAKLPFKVKIQFSSGIRADKLSQKLIDAMRHAGLYRIALGIESGCQGIVDQIGKQLSLEKVKEAARMFRKIFSIITIGYFILGLPFDTRKTMLQTVKFAQEINLDYSDFFMDLLFPGSIQYYLLPKVGGQVLTRSDIGYPGGFNRPSATFATSQFTAQDVETIYAYAYRKSYLRLGKIVTLLAKIRSFYELAYILNYGINTIRNLFTRLKR